MMILNDWFEGWAENHLRDRVDVVARGLKIGCRLGLVDGK
jgi:hypothetical protein